MTERLTGRSDRIQAESTVRPVGQTQTDQAGRQSTVPPPSVINSLQNQNPPSADQNLQDAAGRRVRLRAKPGAAEQIYGEGILRGLMRTNGLVFPYQPTITYQQEVNYQTIELVHTNQDFLAYTKTPALKLTVDGEFTAQTQEEGLYSLACIHFLRTVSKMWFGEPNGANRGTPPPVLLFDAYGAFMFNALPVVVTQFSVTLPKDVDYYPVRVDLPGGPPVPNMDRRNVGEINSNWLTGPIDSYAWVPVMFGIQVQLTVQNTPQRLRTFDLNAFRNGSLLRGGGWV